ncbi:MAG: ABC transporter permease [Pseudomonadota bacterium]|nr:ABC transporter permease [Pseudomonadota bacterium]
MNLAWKDIRRQGLRFVFTGLGLGLLFAIVLAMGGIYKGMVADATVLVDAVGADLWVVQRETRGPFAERSTVPRNLEDRLRVVEGVASAESFTYATIQRGDVAHPVRMGVVGLSWPANRGQHLPLVGGRALGAAHREMIVDQSLGRALGEHVPLGDDVYEVVGVTKGFVSSGGDALVFVTEPDADAILGWTAPESRRLAGSRDAEVLPSAVVVKLLPGYRAEDAQARISSWPEVTVWTHEEQRGLLLHGVIDKARKQIGLFRALLSVVSAIIVALILYNMTVAKSYEIALLKLLGARTRVIVGMILQQALLLGAIGYGMAVAIGGLAFEHFPRRVVVGPEELGGLAALVVLISVLASAAGIVRALRIPPTLVLAG